MKPPETGVSHVPRPDEFCSTAELNGSMAPVVPASSDCALPAGDWDPAARMTVAGSWDQLTSC